MKKQIETLVFFDTESTGLTAARITEISMIAVHRDQFQHFSATLCKKLDDLSKENGNLNDQNISTPRVLNKLTFAVNPMKIVPSTVEELTGLSNYNLEHQPRFKDGAGPAMDLFLAKLRKPVCIVAHNGDRFDFPLLNKELAYAGQTFMDDILCCDSLKFFRASYSSSNKGAMAKTANSVGSSKKQKSWNVNDNVTGIKLLEASSNTDTVKLTSNINISDTVSDISYLQSSSTVKDVDTKKFFETSSSFITTPDKTPKSKRCLDDSFDDCLDAEELLAALNEDIVANADGDILPTHHPSDVWCPPHPTDACYVQQLKTVLTCNCNTCNICEWCDCKENFLCQPCQLRFEREDMVTPFSTPPTSPTKQHNIGDASDWSVKHSIVNKQSLCTYSTPPKRYKIKENSYCPTTDKSSKNDIENSNDLYSKDILDIQPNVRKNKTKPPSFSLPKLYRHIFGFSPTISHGAEVDTIALLQVVASTHGFLQWADDNAVKLCTVSPKK